MCPQADSYREVNAFSNDALYVRKVWDFAKDGGAIDIFDLLKVNEAMVIEEAWVNVKEAVTSAGALTLEVGVKGGDTDAILPATGPAGLLVDTTIDGDAASKRLRLPANAEISAQIKVAAATAGKIELNMVLRKY